METGAGIIVMLGNLVKTGSPTSWNDADVKVEVFRPRFSLSLPDGSLPPKSSSSSEAKGELSVTSAKLPSPLFIKTTAPCRSVVPTQTKSTSPSPSISRLTRFPGESVRAVKDICVFRESPKRILIVLSRPFACRISRSGRKSASRSQGAVKLLFATSMSRRGDSRWRW